MLGRMPRRRWEGTLGLLVAVAAGAYVFAVLQPELLFRDTTTNGGDTGAHVWWPAYLRDHVFPDLRLSGWAPDWYAGFPVGHFYFPVPALLVVALDVALPYNIAFKLVTALGPVLLPVAAYAFGRGIRAPWPAPPLMAAATLPYLFFTGYTIYGGNLPSTLAGEFSFSIALVFALLFLGSLARALEEQRRYWLPAVLLALTVLTHGIVMIFAAVGAIVLWISRRPVRNLRPALAIALVAFLLTAMWTVPVVARVPYMTDMGWGKLTAFRENLFHEDLRWAVVLAGLGLMAGAAFLRRATLELTALTVVFGAAFVVWPEARIWNARLLPFYFLPLLFLAAIGVAEVVALLRQGVESRRLASWASRGARDETGARPASLDEAEARAEELGDRDGRERAREILRRAAAVGTAAAVVAGMGASVLYVEDDDVRDFIPGWIEWNYTGYEGKAAWPEFRELVRSVGSLPSGRLLWERLDRINNYGSDLALELLPYFTDGRIASMEGLYFESSATTPYHFLTVAELASQPSNPVRGLPYGNIDEHFDRGVAHLRAMGVRYFLAGSDQAKEQANDHAGLRFLLETGDPDTEPHVARWAVYEVVGSSVVEPLAYQPAVLEDVAPGDWREPAVDWFNDTAQLPRPLAAGGPDDWARVPAGEADGAPYRPLPEVEVADVETDGERVAFRVSEVGVPVLVKISYFPSWQADGARGPWRVTPNFMVVVPTEERVELTYQRGPVDRAGIGLTLLGVVGVVALARWRPVHGARGPEPAGHGDDVAS